MCPRQTGSEGKGEGEGEGRPRAERVHVSEEGGKNPKTKALKSRWEVKIARGGLVVVVLSRGSFLFWFLQYVVERTVRRYEVNLEDR